LKKSDEPPNGLAQQQRRDWRDSTLIIAPFLAKRASFRAAFAPLLAFPTQQLWADLHAC
jgi:hypothetical protein